MTLLHEGFVGAFLKNGVVDTYLVVAELEAGAKLFPKHRRIRHTRNDEGDGGVVALSFETDDIDAASVDVDSGGNVVSELLLVDTVETEEDADAFPLAWTTA